MDESFYQAHVHSGPHVVLKRRLHPLCLHDILRLMLVNSPYGAVQNNEGASFRVTLGDVRVAVAVCSTPIETFVRETSNRLLWPVLKVKLWKYQTRHARVETEAAAFDEYFNDYFSAPRLWTAASEGESSVIGAPWPLAVVASLMTRSKGAMTRKEIWTAPVGEMLWLNAALMEQEGATEIESAEQTEAVYQLGLRKRPEPKKKAGSRA